MAQTIDSKIIDKLFEIPFANWRKGNAYRTEYEGIKISLIPTTEDSFDTYPPILHIDGEEISGERVKGLEAHLRNYFRGNNPVKDSILKKLMGWL